MLERFKSLLSWNKGQKLQAKMNKLESQRKQGKPSKKGEKNEKRPRGRPKKS